MDFELSEDQEALVDGVRSLLEGRFDIAAVRAGIDGLDRGRWVELAETGVFSMAVPESAGGVGLGWTDAVLVFEQLGRRLVPGPLVAQTLAAGTIPGALDGSVVVAVAERAGDGVHLVDHLPSADVLVVIDDDGLWQLDVADLAVATAARPLDPLTPVGHVESLPTGTQIGDPEASMDWQRRGAVLTSALQLGLATGAMELAVAYAGEREQFGRPIGTFQAIKHICADMLGRAEVCRAAVYMAGVCLDDPEVGDPDRALSVARLLADQAAGANGKDGIQVHGGMGYTWEVDAHLYLKRAWALEPSFGSADHHAEWLAEDVLG